MATPRVEGIDLLWRPARWRGASHPRTSLSEELIPRSPRGEVDLRSSRDNDASLAVGGDSAIAVVAALTVTIFVLRAHEESVTAGMVTQADRLDIPSEWVLLRETI